MPREVIVCRCECGCGRVTKDTQPICIRCLDGNHDINPLIPPKGSELIRCEDCDGFLYFDKKAKMFKCLAFCGRRFHCD